MKKEINELLQDKNFEKVILKKYLNEDILDIVFNENLDAKEVVDELKARQKLRNFLLSFDIDDKIDDDKQ